MGSVEHAEEWLRGALDRGERLMGFGHRVYRAYDPRAAALRKVAEGMEHKPDWLQLAIQVEDMALRLLAERHPDRPLKTNVEFYAAPVLQGVGLTPDLFPATFSLARHAGWTAHVLEQAASNRLIRPDVRYRIHLVQCRGPASCRDRRRNRPGLVDRGHRRAVREPASPAPRLRPAPPPARRRRTATRCSGCARCRHEWICLCFCSSRP